MRYRRLCRFFPLFLFLVPSALAFQSTLDQGIRYLSDQTLKGMVERQKKKIAVMDFSVGTDTTSFGRFLADELTTRLVETKKLTVVERQQLDKLKAEQKVRSSDFADPVTAKKVLSILEVDAIVLGTVTDFPDRIRVNIRVIGIDKGQVFAAASTDIVKDNVVIYLMKPSPASPLGSHSSESSSERFDIGNQKNGSIIEGQHRDYEFSGLTNTPLVFTIRVGECAPRITTRLRAAILDTKGRRMREITVYHDRVQELRFTPSSDDQYIIRIEGDYGRCRYTIYQEQPK